MKEAHTDRLKFMDGLEQTSPLLCKSITEEKVVFSSLSLKSTFTCSLRFKMIIDKSMFRLLQLFLILQ